MNSGSTSRKNFIKAVRVNSRKVSCSGVEGASSHPLVYLNMGKKDSITCPYCSKVFCFDKNSTLKS